MKLLKIIVVCLIILILTATVFCITTTEEPIYYDTPIETGVEYCNINK
jgi:hypothetical protein